MFKSGMRESWEEEVAIPGTRQVIFLLLLEYLYTDLVPSDTMLPETVSSLASSFLLPSLLPPSPRFCFLPHSMLEPANASSASSCPPPLLVPDRPSSSSSPRTCTGWNGSSGPAKTSFKPGSISRTRPRSSRPRRISSKNAYIFVFITCPHTHTYTYIMIHPCFFVDFAFDASRVE